MDPRLLALDVVKAIRGFIARAQQPLIERVAQLETRPAPGPRELTAEEKAALVESLQPYAREAQARWALDFERSANEIMLRAVAAIPEPAAGKDGRDGLGFEDLSVEADGERGLRLTFARGEVRKEFSIRFPVLIDRGVYVSGMIVITNNFTLFCLFK